MIDINGYACFLPRTGVLLLLFTSIILKAHTSYDSYPFKYMKPLSTNVDHTVVGRSTVFSFCFICKISMSQTWGIVC